MVTETAIPAVTSGPDVIAAGQVLAQLNDWRAIMFGLMVVCALLLAALLCVTGFAFRAWIKQSEALGAVGAALAANNVVLATIEARLPEKRDG